MFAVPEDFSAYHKANVDRFVKVADAAGDVLEGWMDLQAKSAKAASAEAASQLRALIGAKDVQELHSLQTAFAQSNAEKAMGYAKAVYGWATETYGQLAKLAEGQIAEANKTFATALDKAAKAAPAGSEYAFTAFKSALSATNQAYDALTRASKQVVEMTEATVAASANGVTTAGRKKVA
jgi:phasin family protein